MREGLPLRYRCLILIPFAAHLAIAWFAIMWWTELCVTSLPESYATGTFYGGMGALLYAWFFGKFYLAFDVWFMTSADKIWRARELKRFERFVSRMLNEQGFAKNLKPGQIVKVQMDCKYLGT